jgi:hypothetical protein
MQIYLQAQTSVRKYFSRGIAVGKPMSTDGCKSPDERTVQALAKKLNLPLTLKSGGGPLIIEKIQNLFRFSFPLDFYLLSLDFQVLLFPL